MDALHLVDWHYQANPDFPSAAQASQIHLSVRGVPIEKWESEGSDESSPLLFMNIQTDFFPHPNPPETEDSDIEFFRTVLSLSINDDEETIQRAPYLLDVTAFGDFSARSLPEKEEERVEVRRVIHANSAALLFGSLRPLIVQMTQLSPFRSLLLPSLQFQKIIEQEEQVLEEDQNESNDTNSS